MTRGTVGTYAKPGAKIRLMRLPDIEVASWVFKGKKTWEIQVQEGCI
jgi:hypothetical protein